MKQENIDCREEKENNSLDSDDRRKSESGERDIATRFDLFRSQGRTFKQKIYSRRDEKKHICFREGVFGEPQKREKCRGEEKSEKRNFFIKNFFEDQPEDREKQKQRNEVCVLNPLESEKIVGAGKIGRVTNWKAGNQAAVFCVVKSGEAERFSGAVFFEKVLGDRKIYF